MAKNPLFKSPGRLLLCGPNSGFWIGVKDTGENLGETLSLLKAGYGVLN
jgi:hypothetical protein